jgi:hypothetical protein
MRALAAFFAIVLLALVFSAGPAWADRSRDQFDAVIDETGSVTDAPDGPESLWFYYENTDWWNVWFYDHPFEWDWDKYIRVWVWVEPSGPAPNWIQITANWSTPAWPPGLMDPPLPPLTPAEEDEYIFRPPYEEITGPGYYVFEFRVSDFFEPPYNPEWVSVDVRGQNVIIIGWIEHICYDPANTQIGCFSWEDGGTILGYYGNLVAPTNVMGPQTGSCGDCPGGVYSCPGASEGERYLHVRESPHSGTPQAYLAWITNLAQGDLVDASFCGYDITPGASPSLRIWAHYTTSGDIEDYQGSASGLYDYTAGTGWDPVEYAWMFDDGGGTRDALVIEARLYSSPATSADSTDYWIDDMCVTAPATAVIHFPEPISPVEDTSWGRIKSMYR